MIVCLGCEVVKLVVVTDEPEVFQRYCSVCQKTTNHRRLTGQDLRPLAIERHA